MSLVVILRMASVVMGYNLCNQHSSSPAYGIGTSANKSLYIALPNIPANMPCSALSGVLFSEMHTL